MNSSKSIVVILIASIAFIAGVTIFSKNVSHRARQQDIISVTGLAEKEFNSDLVNWSASFSRKSLDLKEAYNLLKKDEEMIRTYLQSKSINEKELVFSAVNIDKQYNNSYNEQSHTSNNIFTGYNLSQIVSVESKDIEKVEKLSREITALIETGIELNSSNPSYFYSGLSNLKLALLSQAAKDAHTRADSIAKSSNSSLGSLQKSNMGVFQILGKNTNEDFSEGGTFNTSSRIKKASITVRSEYRIN